MAGAPRAVVVTGLSGAGKSVVTRCFEDLGYRCVDNLPLELIEPLFAHVSARARRPVGGRRRRADPGVHAARSPT